MSAKKNAVNAIKKLKTLFVDDQEANELLDQLNSKAGMLSDEKLQSNDTKYEDVASMPLPEEVVSSNAYALFSDGACRGNPGPGAYGALGQMPNADKLFEASGVELRTTNNQMELKGAIVALDKILSCWEEGSLEVGAVFLYSDSKYVVDGIQKWVPGWKRRGWKKADNKAPENLDLWQELDVLVSKFDELQFKWVKGHSGHPKMSFVISLQINH